MNNKILLSLPKGNKVGIAFSGGLDTSIILKWLQTEYGCEVVTFTADLGQGEDIEKIRQKALKTGAVDAVALDRSLCHMHTGTSVRHGGQADGRRAGTAFTDQAQYFTGVQGDIDVVDNHVASPDTFQPQAPDPQYDFL